MRHSQQHTGEGKQVPVLIRADLCEKAEEQGLNIAEECNRALAKLLHVRYDARMPSLPDAGSPASRAKQSGIPETIPEKTAPHRTPKPAGPVFDAEEYLRTGKVSLPRYPSHTGKPEVPAVPENKRTIPEPLPPTGPVQKKGKRGHIREYGTVKKFFEGKIIPVPEGSGTDSRIAKEQLYREFLRWTVEHSLEHIPDKKIFGEILKNRLNISDITVKGNTYWLNIQLR